MVGPVTRVQSRRILPLCYGRPPHHFHRRTATETWIGIYPRARKPCRRRSTSRCTLAFPPPPPVPVTTFAIPWTYPAAVVERLRADLRRQPFQPARKADRAHRHLPPKLRRPMGARSRRQIGHDARRQARWRHHRTLDETHVAFAVDEKKPAFHARWRVHRKSGFTGFRLRASRCSSWLRKSKHFQAQRVARREHANRRPSSRTTGMWRKSRSSYIRCKAWPKCFPADALRFWRHDRADRGSRIELRRQSP